MTQPAYKRKVPRKIASFPVRIELKKRFWGASIHSGKSKDLSTNGIRLRTKAPITVGAKVNLEFSLGTNTKVIEVQAVAKSVMEAPETNEVIAGFEFVSVPPDVEKYLKTILALY